MIYTLPSGLKVEFYFKHHNPSSKKYVSKDTTPQPQNRKEEFEQEWKKTFIESSIDFLEKNGYRVKTNHGVINELPFTEVHLKLLSKNNPCNYSSFSVCQKEDSFNKETGRKLSLKRLLGILPFELSYEDRKYLWQIALPKKVKV